MTGFRVTMPFASWRDEFSRRCRRTLPVPPPTTVYGFFLSLIGEDLDLRKPTPYEDLKVTAGIIRCSERSNVIRTIIRNKSPNDAGAANNKTLDNQELFTDVELVLWLDHPELEEKTRRAITHPSEINRYGPLSLGESCFPVDSVTVLSEPPKANTFLATTPVNLHLTVIADYATNANAQYASGHLETVEREPLPTEMATIPHIDTWSPKPKVTLTKRQPKAKPVPKMRSYDHIWDDD